MSAQPTTFAVVVTCYNYRAFVIEAVDSALAQTRAPLQVIVVDDGSTDGSPELLRERYGDDPRVELVCGPNGGQLIAFRRGLERVRADVVCFLDADDRWGPDYLAALGDAYDTNPAIDFIFSDIVRFGTETGVAGFGNEPIDFGYTAIATYALAYWYGGPTSALSLKAGLARQCLEMPAELSGKWKLCADAAIVYGASILGGRKLYLPTGAVHYRVHGSNGWWSNRNQVTNYKNRIRARHLIDWYAARAGISERTLESVKFEYRTKKCVPRSERRRYTTIALSSPGPLSKRLERAFSIWLSRRSRQ